MHLYNKLFENSVITSPNTLVTNVKNHYQLWLRHDDKISDNT